MLNINIISRLHYRDQRESIRGVDMEGGFCAIVELGGKWTVGGGGELFE